jgi:isoquinoline 1-oxidoreductase beta subunit
MSHIEAALAAGQAVNLSRRAALAASLGGGLLLAIGVAPKPAAAQAALPHARKVPAYLQIRSDGSIRLLNPFVEGGQGIDTAVAQIIGEELDADPQRFVVECAPPGADYLVIRGQLRITGGSLSVRSSFEHFRTLGATARAMLLAAAAERLQAPAGELTTETGVVLHAASGRRLPYGELAEAAAALPVPATVALKDPARFTRIGKPEKRLDSRAKSTGQVRYAIDLSLPDMLQAAVKHAPRAGAEPVAIANEAALRAMPGVHSVHRIEGTVAVLADRWWRARQAVEAAQVEWRDGPRTVPADFSSAGQLAALKAAADRPGNPAENKGDARAALPGAARTVTADYDAPYLAHGQLEPPAALARFDTAGALELWVPNQAPELFQQIAARAAGLQPAQVTLHSPPLGGFFGRHFTYGPIQPMQQAIALAKAAGRPVKVIWSREEEFARDAYRPLSFARLRAGLDAAGNLETLLISAVGEGPIAQHFGAARMGNPPVDTSVTEGLAGKPYRVPNCRVEFVHVPHPVNVGFWRSVGHSMNDCFFECFLDEVAAAAGKDPLAFRDDLLQHSPRHANLLRTVANLSGGWRRGPYPGGGGRRARGVAMASPFGSETATIAEVSLQDGEVHVHELWVAIDPGRAVNPAIIRAQVASAAAIGLSSALFEEVVFEGGESQSRNFDTYRILPPDRMPRVHVAIVESGATMGGIGEPGTPGVPPAVLNAVAALTGRRIRSMPLARERLGAA